MNRSINCLTGLIVRSLMARPAVVPNGLPVTILTRHLSGAVYDSNNDTHKKIHNMIHNSPKKVFVFMKGVPTAPACGYSDAVCKILNAYDVKFDSYDVLTDDELRKEIKAYSEWPTIPQVYIKGQFVGGCDTLLQMHQSGELEQMLAGAQSPNNDDDKSK